MKMPPRPRTVLSEAEPPTVEEREAWAAADARDWRERMKRMIASFTREQRSHVRALVKRKLEPRGPQGRPRRWKENPAALRQLLADYQELRDKRLSAADSIEILSVVRKTTTKKIEKYLADARKLPPQ